MWQWSLNWGEITPRIVVGTCPMTPDDLARIREGARVSAVLSVQHGDCLAYWNIDEKAMKSAAEKMGLAMVRCPIRDFDIPDMQKHLPGAVSVLFRLIDAGHRVYVHCTAGMGRAPLVVLAYLLWIEGRGEEEAFRILRRGRPEAVPAWEALHGAEADLENRFRGRIEKRAYAHYESGVHHDALKDWRRAKAEVIRGQVIEPQDAKDAKRAAFLR
jgi:atypical dual specificity phosphatase